MAFLLLGIQNFRKPALEMLKVNGIALIILGVLSLPIGLVPIGMDIYFLLWHRKRAKYAELRKQG